MKTTRAIPVNVSIVGASAIYANPIYIGFRRGWLAYCKENGIKPGEIDLKSGICFRVIYRNQSGLIFHTYYQGNPVTIEMINSYNRVTIAKSNGWVIPGN